jgi:hypothetical protein
VREHAEVRTRSLMNRRLLELSVLKVRLVAVVMSGDAVDVSCVSCFCRAIRRLCVVHITSRSPIWGRYRCADTSPTSLIVHL